MTSECIIVATIPAGSGVRLHVFDIETYSAVLEFPIPYLVSTMEYVTRRRHGGCSVGSVLPCTDKQKCAAFSTCVLLNPVEGA
jgi:hypothetical protein